VNVARINDHDEEGKPSDGIPASGPARYRLKNIRADASMVERRVVTSVMLKGSVSNRYFAKSF
jgi:hypothetical protein